MSRIGIVGSDNSHAVAYSRLANIERIAGESRVVAISGPDPARTNEVADQGGIPTIVEDFRDLIGMVDAVLVVHRHGDLHAEHAIPFLEAGIPVYVDKPFAVSLDDCHRMLAAATAGNTVLTSCSSLRVAPTTVALANRRHELGELRVGQFTGPCDFSSEYAGPFFYATHVADIAFALMGDDVHTVRATQADHAVVATVTFASGAVATLSYMNDGAYHFHASLFGTGGFAAGEIIAGDEAYGAVLTTFLDAIRTGTPPLADHQLLAPIAFVNAMQESLANDGAPVDVAALIAASVTR